MFRNTGGKRGKRRLPAAPAEWQCAQGHRNPISQAACATVNQCCEPRPKEWKCVDCETANDIECPGCTSCRTSRPNPVVVPPRAQINSLTAPRAVAVAETFFGGNAPGGRSRASTNWGEPERQSTAAISSEYQSNPSFEEASIMTGIVAVAGHTSSRPLTFVNGQAQARSSGSAVGGQGEVDDDKCRMCAEIYVCDQYCTNPRPPRPLSLSPAFLTQSVRETEFEMRVKEIFSKSLFPTLSMLGDSGSPDIDYTPTTRPEYCKKMSLFPTEAVPKEPRALNEAIIRHPQAELPLRCVLGAPVFLGEFLTGEKIVPTEEDAITTLIGLDYDLNINRHHLSIPTAGAITFADGNKIFCPQATDARQDFRVQMIPLMQDPTNCFAIVTYNPDPWTIVRFLRETFSEGEFECLKTRLVITCLRLRLANIKGSIKEAIPSWEGKNLQIISSIEAIARVYPRATLTHAELYDDSGNNLRQLVMDQRLSGRTRGAAFPDDLSYWQDGDGQKKQFDAGTTFQKLDRTNSYGADRVYYKDGTHRLVNTYEQCLNQNGEGEGEGNYPRLKWRLESLQQVRAIWSVKANKDGSFTEGLLGGKVWPHQGALPAPVPAPVLAPAAGQRRRLAAGQRRLAAAPWYRDRRFQVPVGVVGGAAVLGVVVWQTALAVGRNSGGGGGFNVSGNGSGFNVSGNGSGSGFNVSGNASTTAITTTPTATVRNADGTTITTTVITHNADGTITTTTTTTTTTTSTGTASTTTFTIATNTPTSTTSTTTASTTTASTTTFTITTNTPTSTTPTTTTIPTTVITSTTTTTLCDPRTDRFCHRQRRNNVGHGSDFDYQLSDSFQSPDVVDGLVSSMKSLLGRGWTDGLREYQHQTGLPSGRTLNAKFAGLMDETISHHRAHLSNSNPGWR